MKAKEKEEGQIKRQKEENRDTIKRQKERREKQIYTNSQGERQ